jgi:diamine N-acetyltransferase
MEIPVLVELIRCSFRDVAERFGLTPRNCPKHPSNCEAVWVAEAMQRGVDYFLLEADSGPVGCVAMERSTAEICFLERLAVLPQARGRGFGRALVRHVLETARAQAFSAVSIGIIAEQDELADWYRRCGFVEKETKAFPHLPFGVMFLAYALKSDPDLAHYPGISLEG